MKKRIIVAGAVALAVALMGCGQKPAAPATDTTVLPDGAAPAEIAAPPVDPTPAAGATALPGGFVIPFEHTVVRDRVVTLDDGKQQRRVQLELAGDVAALEKQMDAALVSAGFKAGEAKVSGTQRSVNYRRNGVVELLVVTDASVPEKKQSDSATGTMRLGWNLTDR